MSEEEYEALLSVGQPGAPGVSDKMRRTAAGVVLSLSRNTLEDLLEWVAADANHRRKSERLKAVADAMGAALARGKKRRSPPPTRVSRSAIHD